MSSPSKRREMDVMKLCVRAAPAAAGEPRAGQRAPSRAGRLMSDYKVEMAGDSMTEFYVEFAGPKDSAPPAPLTRARPHAQATPPPLLEQGPR